MVTPENIKKYWNEDYYQYWKKITNGDNRMDVPKEDACFNYFEEMDLQEGDVVLEVGCGFGRLFPYFLNKKTNFYGIDISPQMINAAKEKFPGHEKNIFVADAEALEFPDNFFNKIFCWAVFDSLLHQEIAIRELAGVLSPGGLILISGKHKPYLEDDKEAKIAEIKALEKNHPNTFTNLEDLKSWANKNKLKIKKQFFFLRRGDLANIKYEIEEPKNFYEFVFILEKEK